MNDTTLAFAKLCGAGNDFIVLDGRAAEAEPSAALVARLCDRRYGVGADGLMRLLPGGGGFAFSVAFYNADGSGGMLCGNGARCAIERARELGLVRPGEPFRFRFGEAAYEGLSLEPGLARLELDPRYRMDEPRTLAAGGLSVRGRFVDVGSLHFVADAAAVTRADGSPAYASLDELPLDSVGAAVRSHPDLGPAGVNANFTELRGGRLLVRTFERGVEGETLSCGTGSTASALVRWADGQLEPPVEVVARSGDRLVIDFIVANGLVTRLSLTGPAFTGFKGEASLGAPGRPGPTRGQ